MSRSKRLFRLIQPHLPGTTLCRDILVVGRTDYILRGFLLDTTPQKDHMRLLKVVMPLFRPLSHLMLNYSSEIADKSHGRVFIDTKAYAGSASIVLDEIRDYVSLLRQLSRPADFLGHIAYQNSNPNRQVRFDLGITHYLIGNLSVSLAIFNTLAAEIASDASPSRERLRPLVAFVLRQFETDPGGLRVAIDAWRLHNIELFDLEASCRSASALTSA